VDQGDQSVQGARGDGGARRAHTFAVRSMDVRRHLDVFFVCAVAAVLGNRMFLIIMGYPQIGNSSLHISHAIWGALMMAIAVIVAISYLPPSTRLFVAILGGAGFGWFIDEIGKFISRDTSYFFQPAIAVIYVTFMVMYMVFRSIKARPLGPDEAVLNALEAVKAASVGRLDEARRRETLALLDDTNATGAIAESTAALLRGVPAVPTHPPGFFRRIGTRAWKEWERLSALPRFSTLVAVILVVVAATKLVALVSIVLDGPGVRGFSEWASLVSSSVSGALIVFGAARLAHSRLVAYTWFDRGLLVDILITQVFVFDQRQIVGVVGLAVTIGLWLAVRAAIRAERERATQSGPEPATGRASASSAPVAAS
jgi:hypothetical protein